MFNIRNYYLQKKKKMKYSNRYNFPLFYLFLFHHSCCTRLYGRQKRVQLNIKENLKNEDTERFQKMKRIVLLNFKIITKNN